MSKRTHLPSLLLLPPPPEPATRESLSAAYRPPLETALAKLKHPERSTVLIVALTCPILSGSNALSKTLSWSEAQSLISGLYSIISVLCAKLAIATDMNAGPGSVDTRIVLVDTDHGRTYTEFQPRIEPNRTCVVNLPSFASAYHPWNYIFHVESEAGLRLNATYLKLAEGVQTLYAEQLVPVAGGLTMHVTDTPMTVQTNPHRVACLGGTFDHLHPGHKLLLTAAALLLKIPEPGAATPCLFIVGITGDELLRNKKFAEYVQPWDERARNVLEFLGSVLELSRTGWAEKSGTTIDEQDGDFRGSFRNGTVVVQCVRIQDAFGPTITSEDIEALVVSAETRAGGIAVNERRAELGWHLLEVFEVDVLDAEEVADGAVPKEGFASKISSTAIRQLKAQATGK